VLLREMVMLGALVLVGVTLAGLWERDRQGRRRWRQAVGDGLVLAVLIPGLCWLAINLLVWLRLDWVQGVRGAVFGALVGGALGLVVGWAEQRLRRARQSTGA
jgi:hypothetical protein